MMNLKKIIIAFRIPTVLAVAFLYCNTLFSQTVIIPNEDSRVITTGVPFLLIASDARAAGLGDMGVALSLIHI